MKHEKEGKRHLSEGKHGKGGAQMTKKEHGFGAKLGKHKMGKGPEGPHKGMKGAV